MSDENEEAARIVRAKRLTCRCCTLGHADVETLVAHLKAMRAKLDAQLAELALLGAR